MGTGERGDGIETDVVGKLNSKKRGENAY